jgi:hypothetical protein
MSVHLPSKHQAFASRRLPGCVDPATANVELRPTVPASPVCRAFGFRLEEGLKNQTRSIHAVRGTYFYSEVSEMIYRYIYPFQETVSLYI